LNCFDGKQDTALLLNCWICLFCLFWWHICSWSWWICCVGWLHGPLGVWLYYMNSLFVEQGWCRSVTESIPNTTCWKWVGVFHWCYLSSVAQVCKTPVQSWNNTEKQALMTRGLSLFAALILHSIITTKDYLVW